MFIADILGSAYSDLVADFSRPGRFIDLGCGRVPMFGMYRHLAADVLCVDWPQSLHGTSHIDVPADLNEPIGAVPSDTFDTVIMTDVLEHLRRPEIAMVEAARVLGPGGRLLVGVPFLYWLHEDPHDYHRYTEYRLRDLCGEAGLTVLHVAPYGGPVEVVLDVVAKHVCRSRTIGRVYTWVAHRLAALSPLGPGRVRQFPLGYVLAAEKPRGGDSIKPQP